ncbi:metallophosphoesterase [Azospirillum sp. A39]|uniref:metallophosphoesterase n=1 Tax=Azospirillum sp. A39 TaxID=3462279 RepID=UPI004046688B
MLFGWARRREATEPDGTAAVPRGLRVYAVGDVHGRLDLLDRLLQRVEDDAASAPDAVKYLVFLGDYVDRGPDSAGVVERLQAGPPPGFGAVHLKGNHEQALLQFLDDISVGPGWLKFGGRETLASYGVPPPPADAPPEILGVIQQQFRARLPDTHRRFYAGLRPHLAIGDYLFVHAGIRPGVPLADQGEREFLWIRKGFLDSTEDLGAVVVHGHTIRDKPDVRRNRIGIDTGAYASGRLTCLVLEGTERRFLTT